jgi:hypothetical protein
MKSRTRLRRGATIPLKTSRKHNEPRVGAFKQLLSSPPNIESVSWRKLSISERTNDIPVTNWAGISYISESFFFARWQPKSMFLRTASSQLDAISAYLQTGDLAGRDGSTFWSRTSRGLATEWRDPSYSEFKIRSGPPLGFYNRCRDLCEILNMGIMHLQPGSVKWETNRFAARGYVPELKLQLEINGSLECDPDETPKLMHVQYRSRIAVWDYLLKYQYDTNSSSTLCDLPYRIEAFNVRGPTARKQAEWNLFEIRTTTNRLQDILFSLPPVREDEHHRILYFTNGAFFAKNALGGLSPVSPGNVPLLSGNNWADRNYYFGAIVASTLLAAAILLKTKRQKQHQQNT